MGAADDGAPAVALFTGSRRAVGMRSMQLDSMARVLAGLSPGPGMALGMLHAGSGVALDELHAAPRGAGRPAGDVSLALVSAAAQAPATVRELAQRAGVGYGAARYTATRLVNRGALVALSASRPMVLAAPQGRSFWEEDAAPPRGLD